MIVVYDAKKLDHNFSHCIFPSLTALPRYCLVYIAIKFCTIIAKLYIHIKHYLSIGWIRIGTKCKRANKMESFEKNILNGNMASVMKYAKDKNIKY